MRTALFRTLSLAGLLAVAAPALADTMGSDAQQIRFVVHGGLTMGGDNISTVQTDDGKDKIKAGGLFQVGAGILAQAGTLPLAAQLTYNYHADGDSYENGSTSYHRQPIELTFFYTGIENWRLGAGVRKSGSAKFNVKQDGYATVRGTLESDPALILEAGYALSPSAWLSARYVDESYTLKSASVGNASIQGLNEKVDASHAGVFITFAF